VRAICSTAVGTWQHSEMPKVLAIADDLTGALDVGVQFGKDSIATYVAVEIDCDLAQLFQQFEVVAVNSATRHADSEIAAAVVRDLVEHGQTAGVEFFYKKTDSTLRGNIGAELDAMRTSAGIGRLAFAPASPRLGRTTVGGAQFVFGSLLGESAFASDPRSPVNESFISRIIQQQARVRTTVITRSQLEKANETTFEKEGIYIFDSETEQDLKAVAQDLKRFSLLSVVAGPAAMASYYPRLLKFACVAPTQTAPRGPMLTLIGSVNPVSLEQAVHAQAHGFESLLFSAELLLAHDARNSPDAKQMVDRVAEILLLGKPVILQTARGQDDVEAVRESGERRGLFGSELCERICWNVARIVRQILEDSNASIINVFGGDTLLALARECEWRGFYPRRELLPGVVYAQPNGAKQIHVISKPGGFGASDALVKIREILHDGDAVQD